MKPVGFGIVGCGLIANRHATHILNHPEALLSGVYDIKPEVQSEFESRYVLAHTDGLDELLANRQTDIVNICTPNGTHATLAIACLNAGKHVLVEKPMALTPAQCREMIAASQANNRYLWVVKQNRFNPPVVKLKELIDKQLLGKVYLVQVNCFWNRNAAYYQKSDWKGTLALDGGTLFTQFSHFIDILIYLFGQPENISGRTINASHGKLIEFEDTGVFHFSLPGNALGSLCYTTSSYESNMEGSIAVFAENATIKIGGKYLNVIEYQRTAGFDIEDVESAAPANNYGYYEGSMSNHDKVIANVIDTLRGRDTIMTSALDGLSVVEVISRMYA